MEHLQRMFIIQFCWISPINSAFPSLNFNQMSLIFIEFWIKFSNLVYFLWIEWIVWNVKHDCILVFLKIWKAKFLFPRSFLFWHDSEHSSLQVKTVSRSKLMKLKVLAFSSFHTYNDKWTMWSSNSWQAATIAGQEIETTSLKDFHFLLFHNPPFTYFFGVNLLYMDRLMVKELWWST